MITALVDHDNLDHPIQSRGTRYIAERVLAALPHTLVKTHSYAQFRFYGGWYQGSSMTPRAQRISAQIAHDFPAQLSASQTGAGHHLLGNAELARSLRIDPTKELWRTFRPREFPQSISCEKPSSRGCTNNPCPFAHCATALSQNACPTQGCGIAPRDLFSRDEQKLVDAMLGVDGMYTAQQTNEVLVMVTSDDDLWPPIHSVLATGKNVHLVHTRNRKSPYSSMVRGARGTLSEYLL